MDDSQHPEGTSGVLTLQEAADRLKVHYMTAYRWVRRGELPAFKAGGRLRVRAGDLAAFVEQRSVDTATPSEGRAGRTDWARHTARLHQHLVDGRGAAAGALVRKVIADGAPTGDVYLHLLTPALHRTGDDWAAGRISVSEEHRATEIGRAIIARLGDAFRRRGPSHGTVVTLTPPGEEHSLGCAMLADFVRGGGYDVHHLGANVPVDDLLVFLQVAPSDALCVSVTRTDHEESVLRALVETASGSGDIPTFMGGQGMTAALAGRVGALYEVDLRRITRRLGAVIDSAGTG